MKRPIAVIFDRFGPYHCARLRAVAAQGPVIAIEIVRKDTSYPWDVIDESVGFRRIRLFPELNGHRPTIGEFRRRLHICLGTEQPRAVAIPGWSSSHALLTLGWCLETSTPAVLMSESTIGDKRRTLSTESIKRKLLRFNQAALAGGSRHIQYLHRLGLSKASVFSGYNAVDNAHFSQMQPGPEARSATGPSFLVCCRFIPAKNLRRLLDAYAHYRRAAGNDSWKLVIAGDGPEKDELAQLVKKLRLEASVRFVGFVQYDELPVLYGQAGAFILPSVSEPWGLVVNEAMAAGLPVLVSNRCGCAPDLVEEGRNGFTFDPYDIEELAGLMSRTSSMVEADLAVMGQSSREIISRWTPEIFAVNLMKAVEVAVAAPRPKASVLDKALLWALVHRPCALQ